MTTDNVLLEELKPPAYTKEEREKIVQYLMDLRTGLIREFLKVHNINTSGTKPELRERIEQCFEDEELKYNRLSKKLPISYYDSPK
ncbi:MAG: SAP domain-containing protein [Planctomycetes bacterium]|nr:SAP domain-containing protein [Planctomycetota bacterium]